MQDQGGTVKRNVSDDLSAPTIVIDSIHGAVGTPGMVVFNCGQTMLHVAPDNSMTETTKIVLRLAVPSGILPTLTNYFQGQLKSMIDAGTISTDDQTVKQDGPDKA